MAAAGVRLELTGAETALATLGRVAARAAQPRGLFDTIGASLVTSTQRRFERGVAPDGSPWPPSIRALATGGKTLVDSARLMTSITHEPTDTGVAIGTNVIYGPIHQFGGDIRREAHSQTIRFKRHKRTGKMLPGFRRAKDATESREVEVGSYTIHMPARPFLGLEPDDEPAIIRIAEDWLIGPDGQEARSA